MIKSWWRAQKESDQRLLIVVGIIFFVFLGIECVINPIHHHIDFLKQERQSQQALLQRLERSKNIILKLREAGFSATLDSEHEVMLALVERTLNEKKLNPYLKDVKQPDNNHLVLQFQQVPFDHLLEWIQLLSQQHQINLTEFHATKTDPIGTANCMLTLVK